VLRFETLFPALLSGLSSGAVYALIALGLALIYRVQHVINFAHGAALGVAMYAAFTLKSRYGVDPYLALPVLVPAMFGLGYALQRFVIQRAHQGRDENIALVTLGVAIVLENLALLIFKSDTRTIETVYTLKTLAIGPALLPLPKAMALAGALVAAAVLWWTVQRTDLGRAMRAVAKDPRSAKLVGIHVEHVCAMSFGIGLASLGAAACFLLPAHQVSPQAGAGFALVAFMVVVAGGMGSLGGAIAAGLLVGEVEALGGLIFGESRAQIGIYLIFAAVLALRPQGLFGARA
jgi:branched-chain amino acid transport system permease protein